MEKLTDGVTGLNELLETGQRSAPLSRTTEARAQLGTLIEQMTAAFPHQTWQVDTMKIWRLGFEELVRRHGIDNLRAALRSFLTRTKWFPHPSEVSEVLEEMAKAKSVQERKQLPKVGCDECAESMARGYIAFLGTDGERYMRQCKCLDAHLKAKRELEGKRA